MIPLLLHPIGPFPENGSEDHGGVDFYDRLVKALFQWARSGAGRNRLQVSVFRSVERPSFRVRVRSATEGLDSQEFGGICSLPQ